jgi:hypothetical protein
VGSVGPLGQKILTDTAWYRANPAQRRFNAGMPPPNVSPAITMRLQSYLNIPPLRCNPKSEVSSIFLQFRTHWLDNFFLISDKPHVEPLGFFFQGTQMIALLRSLGLIFIAATSAANAGPTPAWIARSNQLAEPVFLDRGQFWPESASSDGKDEFDERVIDLMPRAYERQLAALKARRDSLIALRVSETDPKVLQDLEILIVSRERVIRQAEIEHQYLLSPADVAGVVSWGLESLLDERNKPERQARSLKRMKRYAGLEAGFVPIASLAKDRTEEQLARAGLVGPYVEGLKQQLDRTDYILKGLSDLFIKAKLTGWESDLAVLSMQLKEYDNWLREKVLPRARTEVRLPSAVYANALSQMGVDVEIEALIVQASFDFAEVRDEMQVLAKQIAQKRNWPSTDYRDVLGKLKEEQLLPSEVLPRYQQRLSEIETIVRREKLVTVPERKSVVRIATDAEAAQIPAPFMRAPRLIGNTGEYGEFVLPLTNPHAKSKTKMDDYTYDAATWTLAAHEARPGHELQFSAMVERGVSNARSIFAFNSANVEGWGLYSEAMLLPYMPPEGQLVSLQLRMMRMARAFLDPMVNLGRITTADAKRFLMEQVMFSEPFSQQEIDRYAFNDPGQATAYYYGYVQLRATRTLAEIALGRKFNLMAFNDFVLEQGLLPPKFLREAVMNEFVPAQLKKPD